MPYRMKNRFLILGLTGPLGAGCSTTGKFLSGFPVDIKISIKALLENQSNELGSLDIKIKNEYQRIAEKKVSVKNRLSKKLGPYKKHWIDPNTDKRVIELEKEIKSSMAKLKIYLRKREVYKTLTEFLLSKPFNNQSLNDDDFKTFGLNPFCYISFTTIITKLAFEKYHSEGGKREFNDYFSFKIEKESDPEYVKAYKDLKIFLEAKLATDKEHLKAYQVSNRYMKMRVYQFILHAADFQSSAESISIEKHNQTISKAYKSYYDFIMSINRTLNSIKGYSKGKNSASYVHALSEILQDWGDNIRATGSPFKVLKEKNNLSFDNLFILSSEINTLIKAIRFRLRYLDNEFKYNNSGDPNRECLFVLECFRNPYEVEFFRSRYAEFYLLSIIARRSNRIERVGTFFSHGRDSRDMGKDNKTEELYKLDVRSCVLLSDIALINNGTNKVEFFERFLRYFSLIRNPGCIPPNDDELYMHLAYSHSLKSTCISRKVGAIILGPKGYILGAGWNDVGDGQVGCGMRVTNDYLNIDAIPLASKQADLKRFKEIVSKQNEEYFCYKDVMSKIYSEKKLLTFKDNCANDCLEKIKSELGIKRLEYCRALHAEENAILQSAKIGGMPIEGGTIYTTTYPCELCAKKLYQTGIRTIYYNEPYPESISEEVFLEDGTKTIERIPFEGVKSHSYFKLFKPIQD